MPAVMHTPGAAGGSGATAWTGHAINTGHAALSNTGFLPTNLAGLQALTHTTGLAPATAPVAHIQHQLPLTGQTHGLNHFAPPTTTFATTNGSFHLGGQGLSLDLSSANADVVLGANLFRGASTATINVGGTSQTFSAGQRVTAGEYLAIKEALAGTGQTITLTASGIASGGDFSLNLIGHHAGLLVIPENVTAVDNLSSSRHVLIAGDLVDYGSIIALSSNSAVTSGSIFGQNITVESGGVINTQSGSNIDLTIAARGALVNQGTIGAGGNLSLVSGSGNFTNSGSITSTSGNVGFSAPGKSTDITINSQGGTVQALGGDINVRASSYGGSGNVTMTGGNFFSNNLNVYSGSGAITGTIGQVSGVLNTDAGAAHLVADTSTLYLGKNSAAGDPTYASTGNIVITGAVTAGEDITILAGGNITASGDASISTTPSKTGDGHDVTLVAGGTVTTSGTQASSLPADSPIGVGTATVDLSTGSGGNIDLSGSTHNGAIISTASPDGNAGNVVLAAVANGATGGQILIANGAASGRSIDASAPAGNGGSITILAGAAPTTATKTIDIGGSIQSSGGGTFQSGNILIATVNPTASTGTTVTYNADGTLGQGSASVVAGANYSANAQVQTGDLISAAGGGTASANGGVGGAVTVNSAGGITTGQILAFGGGGGGGSLGGILSGGNGGNGGAVTLTADASGNPAASVSVNGQINTAGGGGGGSLLGTAASGGLGGTVLINSSGLVTVAGDSTGAAIYSGAGGAGGTDGGNQSTGGGGGGSFGGGGGGAGAGGLLNIVVNAASGGGGAGLFGGGGGGTDLVLGLQALGGGGGGIFGFGTGGLGATVDGHIGGINLGGLGVGVGLLNSSSQGGLLAGLAGAAGQLVNGLLGGNGINVPGLTTTAPSTSNADITITGAGINLGGTVFGRTVTLNAAPGSNAPIALTHDIYGTAAINLNGDGTGAITNTTAKLYTPVLNVNTDDASIGTSANPLLTTAAQITAMAGGSGSNVYINDDGPAALVGANFAGTAGSGGIFSLNAGGDITAGAEESLKADTVNLGSTAGDIGKAATPLLVTAPTLTANATGDVYITDDAAGNVNLGASSAGATAGTFSLDATKASGLTTTGDVAGHVVTLKVDSDGSGITVGGAITGTNDGTVNLTAGGAIQDGAGAGTISGAMLNLTANDGDIGSVGTPLDVTGTAIAANASGNVYLKNTGSVDLQDGSAGGGDTFSVATTPDGKGNGQITVSGDIAATGLTPIGTISLNGSESGNGAGGIEEGATTQGTLTATNVSLGDGVNGKGTADIGSAVAPVMINATGLDATTQGAVYVANANTGNMTLGDLSGSSIDVATKGSMTTGQDITTPGTLTLTGDGLSNGKTITAGNVQITGNPGSDLDVENSGQITATNGNVEIDSATGKNVMIGDSGGPVGTITTSGSGQIIVNANGDNGSTNGIVFTGSQDLNTDPTGKTVLNANSGPGQFIEVQNGATVTGNNEVDANTGNLKFEGTGSLIGNPLIINGGNSGVTVANSSGDVILSNNMIFEGQSVAILASGNIEAKSAITIDLSNSDSSINSGDGGNLTIVAGYNFTPATQGTTSTNQPFTIGSPSSTGGSVELGLVTIKTGSSVTDGSGGNVVVIAHTGNNLGGSITLGTIDTSANGVGSVSSAGGSVQIIGQGVTVGNINTSAITGGAVTIDSATPMTNGTVVVTSGTITSGSFSPTAGTFSGNIVIGAINTGNAAVTLTTGGAGGVSGTSAGNGITGQSLALTTGTGGAGTFANPIYTTITQLTADAGTSGEVYFANSSNALTIAAGTTAKTFSLTNTTPGAITLAQAIPTSNLYINDVGGTIDLPSSDVTVNADTVTGNGGSIYLAANTITSPTSQTAPFVFNANATNLGTQNNGGSITVLTNMAQTSTIGNGAGQYEFNATGSGNGGAARFANDGGDVIVNQATGINIAGGANGKGATYFIEGQSVSNFGGGTLIINADGHGTGDGGSITVNQLGNHDALVGLAPNADFQLSAVGTNGGTVNVMTGGNLTVDFAGLKYQPTSVNGNGGNVFLTGATVKDANQGPGPFILNASANPLGTGSGGSAGISLTTAGTAATVGTLPGQYELVANSGKLGGNGGAATFFNAGDLTVNPAGIKVGPLSKNGNGGSITLEAGHNAVAGNLLVIKSINANAKGKGNGGTIDLTANGGNFTVGGRASTTNNGVLGSIAVKGKVKGVVDLNNVNGDVSVNNSLAAVSQSTIIAGGTGNILIASNLGTGSGTAETSNVTLVAGGSITSKTRGNTVGAKVVDLEAGVPNLFGKVVQGSGNATIGTSTIALGLKTQRLTAHAPTIINLADKSTTDLTLLASSGSSFTLSNAGNIIVAGDIDGGSAVSLKSGASKGITAESVDDVLTGTSVTFNGGKLGVGTTASPINFDATKLTVNSAAGPAFLNSVGAAALEFDGSKNSKALTLTTLGDILLNGPIGTTGATVNITSTGGSIEQGGATNAVVNGKVVTLTANGGTIGLNPTQSAANAVLVKAANLTLLAPGGLVNVSNLTTSASTLATATGVSVNYLSHGATSLGNITASGGNILVNDTKGLLQTLPNDSILATNGKISLQESSKLGTITLGGNSQIATSGVLGGDVDIFIGATPLTGEAPKPAGVTEVITPPNTINYGVNGITLAKNATATFTAEGANIIISTGTARASAIKVNSGVTITADPPTNVMPVINPATLPIGLGQGAAALTSTSVGLNLGSYSSTSPLAATAVSPASSSISNSDLVASSLRQIADIKPAGWMQETAWASETELASGEIPALLVTGAAGGESLGVKPGVTLVSDLKLDTDLNFDTDLREAGNGDLVTVDRLTAAEASNLLVGGVSKVVQRGRSARSDGGIQRRQLSRGSVVFAPLFDIELRTPLGRVKIGAHSVVLVMATGQSLAVYDLDDCARGAVSLQVGKDKQEVLLRPGFGAVVAQGQIADFSHINPAQLFGYRGIQSRKFEGEGNLSLFTSEFSILQALATVQPLKQLVASKEDKAQHLTGHMLKTAGILMQLGRGGQYKQVLRTQLVAWSK